MIFFEQFLTTLTFIIISVFVMPAAAEPDTAILKLCSDLVDTCNEYSSYPYKKKAALEIQDKKLAQNIKNLTKKVNEESLTELTRKMNSPAERSKLSHHVRDLFTQHTLEKKNTSDKPWTTVEFCEYYMAENDYVPFFHSLFTIIE